MPWWRAGAGHSPRYLHPQLLWCTAPLYWGLYWGRKTFIKTCNIFVCIYLASICNNTTLHIGPAWVQLVNNLWKLGSRGWKKYCSQCEFELFCHSTFFISIKSFHTVSLAQSWHYVTAGVGWIIGTSAINLRWPTTQIQTENNWLFPLLNTITDRPAQLSNITLKSI